jgi:hypothetical protein
MSQEPCILVVDEDPHVAHLLRAYDPCVSLRDMWFLSKPLDFDHQIGFMSDVLETRVA